MPRKRGDHNQPQETKRKIIEFVLDYPNGIEEPILREYLRNTLNISEQKNIKIHLEDLRKKGCLEKIENIGFANKWVIKDIKNIKNIINFFDFLPVLQQKSHAVTIIASLFFDELDMSTPELREKHGHVINEIMDGLFNKIKFMLTYSPSFFEYVVRCGNSIEFYMGAERIFYTDIDFIFSNRSTGLEVYGEKESVRTNGSVIDSKEFRRPKNYSGFGINALMKHCLKHDVLYGRATIEGKKCLADIVISELKDHSQTELEAMKERRIAEEEIRRWIEGQNFEDIDNSVLNSE